MSEEVVKAAAGQCAKFRTSFRFLLQNLADFTCSDAMHMDSLHVLDRLVLLALSRCQAKVKEAFGSLNVAAACEALDAFCREDLSRTYFSMSKSSLYFSAASDPKRRSCQTALWLVLQGLLTMLAPVTSFLCEEVWSHVPKH